MPKGCYTRKPRTPKPPGQKTDSGAVHRIGQAAAIKKPRRTQLADPKQAAITLEDCTWVFQHAGTRPEGLDKVLQEAPSPGAAGLLVKALDDKAIYKWVIDRLAPSMFNVSEEEALSPGDMKAVELAGLAVEMRNEFLYRVRKSENMIARALDDAGDGDADVPGCAAGSGVEQEVAGVPVAAGIDVQADETADSRDLLA